MLIIPLCITGIHCILKCIQIKNATLNCNDIFQYYHFYCTFNQINAVLLSIRIIKKTDPKPLNSTVSMYSSTIICHLHHCKATVPCL